MTPSWPESGLQSLPPKLGSQNSNSIPSCSKAPRGLFVLLQVDGIFTVIAISPGSSLRQFPSRYAFHAGQNLPVKEFRSLLLLSAARQRVWIFLSHSLCYHRGRTISSPTLRRSSAFSLWGVNDDFPADCLCDMNRKDFQHIADLTLHINMERHLLFLM